MEATAMKATTIGIDLAKNVFQIHGVDERGNVSVKTKRAHRWQRFFQPAALVGMEASAGAHFWARKLQGMGHTVRLIAAQFVKPYVKTNKNDAAAAEAICEALSRPGMRARQGFVKERTAQANQIRGFLSEFGIVIPQGIRHIERCLPSILEDGENELAVGFRQLLARLMEHLRERYRQVEEIEAEIKRRHQDNDASCKLTAIPGIGP
jgi:transposase